VLPRTIAGCLVMLIVIQGISVRAAEGPKAILSSEVRGWQQHHKNFMLIDCRSRSIFETKHIEGAVSIPVFELGYVSLPKGRDMIPYKLINTFNPIVLDGPNPTKINKEPYTDQKIMASAISNGRTVATHDEDIIRFSKLDAGFIFAADPAGRDPSNPDFNLLLGSSSNNNPNIP